MVSMVVKLPRRDRCIYIQRTSGPHDLTPCSGCGITFDLLNVSWVPFHLHVSVDNPFLDIILIMTMREAARCEGGQKVTVHSHTKNRKKINRGKFLLPSPDSWSTLTVWRNKHSDKILSSQTWEHSEVYSTTTALRVHVSSKPEDTFQYSCMITHTRVWPWLRQISTRAWDGKQVSVLTVHVKILHTKSTY